MIPDFAPLLNISFVALGALFFMAERIFPERKINHFKELKVDLMALGLLMFSGACISNPLIGLYRTWDLALLDFIHQWPSWFKVLLATLLTDFLNYWIHYWMHKSNAYWKTHVFHHRIQNLYWFSGLRASLGHYTSFILSRMTVGILLFKLSAWELFAYLFLGMLFNFFQHTNAKLGGKWVEWILISPRVHRLHHASNGRRMKNLGTIFSFWDRLFGTFENPESNPKEYELGVKSATKDLSWKEFLGI